MIVIFCSNIDGGIVQFAVQMVTDINELGMECICFLPKIAKASITSMVKHKIQYYEKVKSFSASSDKVKKISNDILKTKPDLVWFIDSSILSAEVCLNVYNKVKTYINVHDPIQNHPTYHVSVKYRIKEFIVNLMKDKALNAANSIILLSSNSKKVFDKKYPNLSGKTKLFTLGAHIPNLAVQKPSEIEGVESEYFLFFGRIDKYKGINNLLKSYKMWNNKAYKLIIAGKGVFSSLELELIKNTSSVIAINRYIEDSEQIWLFKNAKCVVLPYIEASQSGIIPIAYKFGVPVVVSSVPGLSQYVNNGQTGYVCNNIEDYISAYNNVITNHDLMCQNCIEYYSENMEWKTNLKKLLGERS